ncbi:Crp/Fnr family transcriptional regulator [Bradyrhizobium sp. CIAT3101]|uniref:Crp/Fnr family transcriptional regulator n=1 Tax=Bradyrhizobium sp. CIAT3101 TaxID=439387 RepID=UPI0024B13BF7|nr:Crp/Fnr family transcriptional regulator [Bradyrhizobium sp. CIAT3101]WFU80515.1 Crp/Fnr family transcriptional regulator [Bradyrhizobium sp. CIAT3101]
MTDQFLSVSGGRKYLEAATFKQASDMQGLLYRRSPVCSGTRPFVKNGILASIALEELAAIGEYLEPVVLRERMILQEPKKQIEHIYFIESGLVSLRILAAESILETAVIGHRGVVGASLLAEGHLATRQSVVLVSGSAYRILVQELRRLLPKCSEVREHLVRYVQAQNLHCAQTGLCGVRHDREKRLACWLCLASDALQADVLPITHDYLSSMLGLRRPGVTETLIRFEQQELIRKTRGILQIRDRRSLEQKACSCYKLITGAYFATEFVSSATDGVCASFDSHVSSI